ncbi:alkene reductase [Govanella unica]|uniref:Alkene reductase n=1 Tax=Govanella unica TaxID=2975056 RepID=A0A9X3TWR0_9PROT|nr:alkene reductase [Govania unica]MDA5193153.1 alkene reductase [Govania unica]
MPGLFTPLTLGDLDLPNRIIMSPLTRTRAVGEGNVPNDLMVEYYRQRASAGLIISEGVPVSPQGIGYANVPGIWSDAQVAGWKKVTKAVHNAGGRIFMQIWHVGRVSDPSFLNGELPVGPSALAAPGHVALLRPKTDHVTPRALDRSEIPGIVEDFRKGAENAKRAGFDGVEIHGANGYLLDQFLQTSSNQRTDDYGGSLENRARLMLEVTDAAISVWGPGRVGMHLAPRGDVHGMGDNDLEATFTYVARELGKRRIAFLLSREKIGPDSLGPKLKTAFGGVYVANEGLTKESAEQVLNEGWADAVAFGKDFIANPDLPQRLALDAPLNPVVFATMYGATAEGYTDYPAFAEAAE